jgi:hypothetical protein
MVHGGIDLHVYDVTPTETGGLFGLVIAGSFALPFANRHAAVDVGSAGQCCPRWNV